MYRLAPLGLPPTFCLYINFTDINLIVVVKISLIIIVANYVIVGHSPTQWLHFQLRKFNILEHLVNWFRPVMLNLDIDHFFGLDATFYSHAYPIKYRPYLFGAPYLLDHYVVSSVHDGDNGVARCQNGLML